MLQKGEQPGGLGAVDKAFAIRVCSVNQRENRKKQSSIAKGQNNKKSKANAKIKLEFSNASESNRK